MCRALLTASAHAAALLSSSRFLQGCLFGSLRLRPTLRGPAAGAPCYREARRLAKRAGHRWQPAAIASCGRNTSKRVVDQMGGEMAQSRFCLVPAGDTCDTSRLYSAIAAGCVPVVLCDRFVGALT